MLACEDRLAYRQQICQQDDPVDRNFSRGKDLCYPGDFAGLTGLYEILNHKDKTSYSEVGAA